MLLRSLAFALPALLLACGSDPATGTATSGSGDSGVTGSPDATAPAEDAGGPSKDGGPSDASMGDASALSGDSSAPTADGGDAGSAADGGPPDAASCVEGAACDDGDACTVADKCRAGRCAGLPKVCDAPPAAACVSSKELVTHDATGTCSRGACVYTERRVTCGAGGCVGDACVTDPCATITCNSPPSPCFKANGTCQKGRCEYAYDDGASCNDGDACTEADACVTGACRGKPRACVSPPASRCEDEWTLRLYDAAGKCGGGACSYPYRFVTCSSGCKDGQCVTGQWTHVPTGVTHTLNDVWGAGRDDVFAVGERGTVLRYNGVAWKTMGTPVGATALASVSGTASDNVFALGNDTSGKMPLIRFDGATWTKRSDLGCDGLCCVGAIGPDDAYVWNGYYGELRRVTGGVDRLVGSLAVSRSLIHKCDVRVLGPDDVIIGGPQAIRFDGKKLAIVGGSSPWQVGALSVIGEEIFGTAWLASRWDGLKWQSIPTGVDATNGVFGVVATRVFGVGGTSPTAGTVHVWDGSGWSAETVPAGTKMLNAVWVAPTGEAYAVGAQGETLVRR